MIISIEDGTLHPDLPFLAWLMIALSKLRRFEFDQRGGVPTRAS